MAIESIAFPLPVFLGISVSGKRRRGMSPMAM